MTALLLPLLLPCACLLLADQHDPAQQHPSDVACVSALLLCAAATAAALRSAYERGAA
jgi:hypothetical protein